MLETIPGVAYAQLLSVATFLEQQKTHYAADDGRSAALVAAAAVLKNVAVHAPASGPAAQRVLEFGDAVFGGTSSTCGVPMATCQPIITLPKDRQLGKDLAQPADADPWVELAFKRHPTPDVAISKTYKDWCLDADIAYKKAKQDKDAGTRGSVRYPITKTRDFKFAEFLAWKKGKSSTSHQAKHHLNLWLSMVDFDAGEGNLIHVVRRMYEDDLLSQLSTMPILEPAREWTPFLLNAFAGFVEWLSHKAGKRDVEHWERQMSRFATEIWSTKERSQPFISLRYDTKHKKQKRVIKQLDLGVLKAAVKMSMIVLDRICSEWEGAEHMPRRAAATANNALCGILALNNVLGRLQEYRETKRSSVKRQLFELGQDWLELDGSKSEGWTGKASIPLFPGTKTAILKHLGLPVHKARAALDEWIPPATPTATAFCVSVGLKGWPNTFIPGADAVQCNLMRKLITTVIKSGTRAVGLVARRQLM